MQAELDRVAEEKQQIKIQKAALKLQCIKLKDVPAFPVPVMELKNVKVDKDDPRSIGLAMLPPAHIDMMASRYAVKMFLAHLYEKWREWEGLEVAEPYMIAIKNHTHKVYAQQVAPKK